MCTSSETLPGGLFGAALVEQVEAVRGFVAAHVVELSVAVLLLVGGRLGWRRLQARRKAGL